LILKTDVSAAAEPAGSRSWWLCAFVAFWLVCAVSGLYVLWAYDNRPGIEGNSPQQWPVESRLRLDGGRPTLVFLAHPQCSCTRASIGELREALARARSRPKTYVVFMKPSSFATGWEKTGLWEAAMALPDTIVVRDDDGRETTRFGAVTSGQTLLYDADGTLLFSGGITAARAHAGDNEGRSALVALLNEQKTERSRAKVFGCSLFARLTGS
jgi:hypothetical protein